MFQFPTFPLPVLCVHTGVTPHDGCRVSPFGHPRINAFSAASRGLSQPDTSFIGSRRQGIHRWLFVAWKNKDARARYAVLKGRQTRRRPRRSEGRRGAPSKRNRGRRSQRARERRVGTLRPSRAAVDIRVASASTGSSPPDGGDLLRKEVIQPHLPVRLPCYDFTPIADPTFDSSFPEGLGHWLRALPTFVV
jgi:hypothetical protein